MSVIVDKMKSDVLGEIYRLIGSSEFLVVINGLPKRHNGSFVYVKPEVAKQSVEFFTPYRADGKTFQYVPKNLEESVLNDLLSGELFGFDFSNWLESFWKQGNQSQTFIQVNNNLKILFLETPLYRIFRENIPVRMNLTVEFTPTLNDGSRLGVEQLATLLGRFRVNGFRSLLQLERAGIGRRIMNSLPRLYRIGDAFSLCMVDLPMMYNPFVDDKMLYNQIAGTQLMQSLIRRQITFEKIGASMSVLSNEHICRGLGIKELVPFNFHIFVSLFAGLIMPPEALTKEFPNKNKIVMRLTEPTDQDIPRVLDAEEFLNDLNPNLRGMYSQSNSLRTFVLENSGFFQSRGFRRVQDLMDLLEDAVLV